MRHATAGFVITLLLTGAVLAGQQTTVTTDTKVKSDNGKVVTITGCVMIGGGTSFLLTNITSEVEQGDRATSPATATYALTARDGLDLGPHIHQRVELTGVEVPAATKGDKDDKIEIKETTEVDVKNGPDKKSSETTTVRVPRGATKQFLVASVKTLAHSCDQ